MPGLFPRQLRKGRLLTKTVDFLESDIWRIHSRNLSRRKSFFIKLLRIFLLAMREFYGNKCQLGAAALTFYTLLSIVPLAAMAFGIAKGFGFEETLAKNIVERFPGQEATLKQIIDFANNLIANTKGGWVAGIGVILLFWTVVKGLRSIEDSFNGIWGVKKGRPFARRVSDYLSIMLICPFLVIISGGITVFLRSGLTHLMDRIPALGPVSLLVYATIEALPYCMVWVLFAFVYVFMPYTKVNLRSAIIAGIVAGTSYQIVQTFYIALQIGAVKMNAIYGSFAAIPLFLMWVQLSWMIILFGAEVSFAHQNVDTYEFEHDCLNASHAFKRLLSLEIAGILVKNFAAGGKPMSESGISENLDIPTRLARDILFELSRAGIVSESQDEDARQIAYQPARDINMLSIQYVMDALEGAGSHDIPVGQTMELHNLSVALKSFDDLIKISPSNALLKDI
ncbi:MAG: YihY/virulence factor BrkB family protein [Planctomycetota bacterium]